MNILLLGSKGGEHAMARELARAGHTLYCLPGNPGLQQLAHPLSPDTDPIQFARKEGVELTIASSERLLAGGIADRFREAGLRLFGPQARSARIGSSRLVAKQFMLRHEIPTSRFVLCRLPGEVIQAAESFNWQVAIKSLIHDQITLCSSRKEVESAIGGELLVEERLWGDELSLSFFCDGEQWAAMPPIVDQKLLCDGGSGLQTGGMGAWVPEDVPYHEQIEQQIIEPTRKGLVGYRGILSLVIMITADGPKLLEYRCQCGDPEAQTLFPLFYGDLAETFVAAADGHLSRAFPQWKADHSCTVVLSTHNSALGGEVRGLQLLDGLDSIFAYQGATRLERGRVVTAGGRVLSVTGVAPTLAQAVERAYQGAGVIHFPGKFHRTDIGSNCQLGERLHLGSRYSQSR